jgi:hypothetical protein
MTKNYSGALDCIIENLGLKDLGEEGRSAIDNILKQLDEDILEAEVKVDEAGKAVDAALADRNTVDKYSKKLQIAAKKALYDKAFTDMQSKQLREGFFSKKFRSAKRILREAEALINGKTESSFVSTSDYAEKNSMRMYLEGLNKNDPNTYNKMLNYYASGDDDGALMKAVRVYAKTLDESKLSGYMKTPHDIEMAKNIAEGMLKVSEHHRGMLVDLGAIMGKINGYIGKQRFDRTVIADSKIDDFFADVETHIDIQNFLGRNAYSKYKAGNKKVLFDRVKAIHENFKKVTLDNKGGAGFGGHSRDLFFKSAEAEAEFMYKYGTDKTPMDIIAHESATFGGNTAMWTWTGPNPKSVFGDLATDLREAVNAQAPSKGRTYSQSFASYANRYIDAHVGMAGEPVSDIVKGAQIAKLLNYFRLGSVIKTALPADFGQRVLTNLFQGQSFSKALSATTQAAQLLKQDASFLKPWSSLGKSEQQKILDRVTGSITQTVKMTMAQSMRMDRMDVDADGSAISKAHAYASDAVSKFMEYTWIDPATKLQQNAVAIEKTPLYIKAIKGGDEFFFADMNLTKKQAEGLAKAGKLLDSDNMLEPELKQAGVEVFDANTLLELDPEIFGGKRAQMAVVQKLKGKLNAEMRTSVTQMAKGDNQPFSGNVYSQVLGVLITTFKPTILKQTADNWHIIGKAFDRFGLDGAGKRAGQYLLYAGASTLLIDQAFSILLNEKSMIEEALVDGDYMKAALRAHDKYTALPAISDLMSAGIRANYRQGFGGISNNVLGPVFQSADGISRAMRGQDKLFNVSTALADFVGITGLTSSNILVKAASRNLFEGDFKPDRKEKDYFKEQNEKRKSEFRKFIKDL